LPGVAIVTGASRGIGRAIAEELQAAGFSIAACASTTAPDIDAAFNARCDVSDEAQVRDFFAKAAARGAIDAVVLNAGVLERGPIEDFTAAAFDRVLGVNLRGAFLCAREAFRHKAKRIVAVGSISGTLGTPQSAAYNASKWGLTGLMKSLAEEGRDRGVFCATVLPGGVETEMIKKTPFPAQMQPRDVARVVTFLCTQAPFAMTGSAVEVFG
jgi:NAD(P)-dependent dehydrogenase (short-subunit alcohol dehydrogenase family)